MGQTGGSPDRVFLLGREIGVDGDVLSIRDPTLRVLKLDRLPRGMEPGVASALLEPTGKEDDLQVFLEVIRPSGAIALSMSGTIDTAPSGHGGVWARAPHMVIDEAGEWIVRTQTGQIRAARVIDVVLEAAE
ncbi:hypothetical protein [Nocardiopsis halotolerans]|uniref:hypothetical protein n=1 Tax=Nocardiopsis halotolerans TaxID=124252 RepID=UPI00037DC313|nr:hypothetical protein [Nocardiopsis halotolerans]